MKKPTVAFKNKKNKMINHSANMNPDKRFLLQKKLQKLF